MISRGGPVVEGDIEMFLVPGEPGADASFEVTDGRLDTNYFVLGIESAWVDCETGALHFEAWGELIDLLLSDDLDIDPANTEFEGTLADGHASGRLRIGAEGDVVALWSATQE